MLLHLNNELFIKLNINPNCQIKLFLFEFSTLDSQKVQMNTVLIQTKKVYITERVNKIAAIPSA